MCETPSERVAVIVLALARGRGLTTRQTAELTGLTLHGAYSMLCRISRSLPIYKDDAGIWKLIDDDPLLITGRASPRGKVDTWR